MITRVYREAEGVVSIGKICREMGVSRQGYYQLLKRAEKKAVDEERVLSMVRMVRRRHPRMGVRKLLFKIGPMMAQEGLRVGTDGLFELLRG